MNRITTYIRQSLQDINPPEEVKALSMLICCDMLGLDALDIYMGKDIILSACKQRELENIIFRLQKNEPIQYIRGYAEFGGRNFRVAPGVLIPRPETAELVSLIVKENPDARRLLDIGTGSGCIAISLSKSLPGARVDAWDISEEALTIARKNNEELDAQVTFCRQDVFSADGMQSGSYDIIVSNPPYVTETEKREMEALSGMRAEIGNDANVAALGEMWLGAGIGRKNIVMVTLGTGVGGGFIIGGLFFYLHGKNCK